MGKIWKWHTPFFTLAVKMACVDEVVDFIEFANAAFVLLAIMFIGDLLVHLEERRKKPIMFGSDTKIGRWFRDEGWHISNVH